MTILTEITVVQEELRFSEAVVSFCLSLACGESWDSKTKCYFVLEYVIWNGIDHFFLSAFIKIFFIPFVQFSVVPVELFGCASFLKWSRIFILKNFLTTEVLFFKKEKALVALGNVEGSWDSCGECADPVISLGVSVEELFHRHLKK